MKFELVNFSEIDINAIKSYCAIHNVNENKNLGDIQNINILELPKDITLLTHGSPCVAFSKAGLQKGGDKGSETPSALMWYSVEIIKHCKPKFVIWENVANVLSIKHRHNFNEYINELKDMGYSSYYKILNAKNYGLPQNRERIFVISILDSIDKGYVFPDEQELHITLQDIVEPVEKIESKYYLTDIQIKAIENSTYGINSRRIQRKTWCDTLCARDWKDPKCYEDAKGVRKLTPNEYWRIMGFKDSDFIKAKSTGQSNSALYKQAGNSIAYNVSYELLKNLIFEYGDIFTKDLSYISLFSGVGSLEMALRDL